MIVLFIFGFVAGALLMWLITPPCAVKCKRDDNKDAVVQTAVLFIGATEDQYHNRLKLQAFPVNEYLHLGEAVHRLVGCQSDHREIPE